MILFAHGLEGSPQGRKVSALRQAGFQVRCDDLRGQPLVRRVEALQDATYEEAKREPVLLVGSSYGGLAAAIVAQRHPERFCGMVLCAPALCLQEPPSPGPEGLTAPDLPVTILHGLRDRIVPMEVSRDYTRRSRGRVRLIELDDEHPLDGSLELLVAEVRGLLVHRHMP